MLACVAFIVSLKNGTVTLVICYALKCVCWLGLRSCLFQFAEGLRMKDMALGELRFFLPWTAFHVTRKCIPALTPQQPQGHASSSTCRLACRSARRWPPRSPRFARLARRPALDMQAENGSDAYSQQRMWIVTVLHFMCRLTAYLGTTEKEAYQHPPPTTKRKVAR